MEASGCDATKGRDPHSTKKRAPNTNQNAYIKPHIACKKKDLSSAESPLIAGLYVVFATQKPVASRCFRHLIELCVPLIMDVAL